MNLNKTAQKIAKCGSWAGSDFEQLAHKYGITNSDQLEELSQKVKTIIEKKKEKQTPRTACYIGNEYFADAVIHNGKIQFVKVKNNGEIDLCPEILGDDGKHYLPLNLQDDSRLLKLPAIQNLKSKEELPALYSVLKAEISSVFDAGNERNLDLFALWICGSYRFDLVGCAPYLRMRGPYGTGKTRGLDVIAHLSLRPLSIGPSLTEAFVFRLCEIYKPTACLNEFDEKGHGDYSSLAVQLLNSRYERGHPIGRMGGERGDIVQLFDPFGATAFSARSPFSDSSLESRCLEILCAETEREDIPSIVKPEDMEAKFSPLRNRLYSALRLRPNAELKSPPADSTMPRRFRQLLTALWASLPDELIPELQKLMDELAKEEAERLAASSDGELWLGIFDKAAEARTNGQPFQLTGAIAGEIIGLDTKKSPERAGGRRLGAIGFKMKKSRARRFWTCKARLWEKMAVRLGSSEPYPWRLDSPVALSVAFAHDDVAFGALFPGGEPQNEKQENAPPLPKTNATNATNDDTKRHGNATQTEQTPQKEDSP